MEARSEGEWNLEREIEYRKREDVEGENARVLRARERQVAREGLTQGS